MSEACPAARRPKQIMFRLCRDAYEDSQPWFKSARVTRQVAGGTAESASNRSSDRQVHPPLTATPKWTQLGSLAHNAIRYLPSPWGLSLNHWTVGNGSTLRRANLLRRIGLRLKPPTPELRDEAPAIVSCIVDKVSNNCERSFRAVFLDWHQEYFDSDQ